MVDETSESIEGVRLRQELQSGDPSRVEAALAELEQRWHFGREVPLPAPEPDVLDVFPRLPPWKVVNDFISVLGSYHGFHPPISAAETLRRWVEAVIRYDDGTAAVQVALNLRGAREPGADVPDAIAYVRKRGLHTAQEERGAANLARALLDHSETHSRAVSALRSWMAEPRLAAILRGLVPYLAPDERKKVGLRD